MDTALSPKMLRSQIIPSTNDNTSLGISSIQLRKSASNDDLGAAAADATHSIFSFLTATARAKSIRVDEFDGDAEEDNFEEDEETDSDLDNEEEDNEEEDDEEEELEEGAQLPPDSEGSAEPDNVELPQLSQASENLHKPDSHLSRATVDSMQNSILYKTKSKNKEVKDKDLDSDRKDMAVDVERQHKIKPWTPSSSLLGSVYSLKKVPSRLGAPRANALTDKLKSQLGIEDDDQLIGDYPCWLLKNILLQGHLYLTNRHLCFFAYLPRNRAKVIHSGSLSKRGRKRPTFSRYWFILRDDSLSYYSNSTDLYFPSGTIDLRYAIQAEIVGQDKKTSSHFTILTENRSYHFKADSPKSAHEWVKSLQREIFRSRNEGDSVKIVIPVGNVIDLEQSSILDMALSLKIRAIDGEETYAIDEYVFTFFRRAEEVVEHIKSAMKKLGVSGLAIEEKEKDLAKNDIIKSEPISPFFEPIIDSTDVSVPRFSLPGSTSETQPQLQRRGRSLLSTRFRSRSPSASGTGAKSSSSKGSLQQRNAWSPSPMRSITGRMKHLFEDSSREHSPSASGTTSPNNSQSNSPVSHPEFFLSAAAAASALKKSEKHLSETYDFLNASDTHQLPSENLKHKKRFSMVNKVTEMWGGGKKHFKTPDEALSMREDRHLVSEQEGVESNERFRHHFSLSEGESLVATYFCYIQKALPIYGKMYLGTHNLCFRSLFPGISTKMILPITDIENVTKEKGFRFGYSGLVVVIHGHEEVFFEFGAGSNRDDCEVMLLRALDRSKQQNINLENSSDSSYYATRAARLCTYEDVLRNELEFQAPPLIISDDTESVNELECFLNGPQRSYKFTLLTIGSRGDVQPYIALAKGLLLEGHKVRIATHAEFRPWIEKYGIEFAEIAGDPAQLMKIMGEHGKFSVSFVREAASRFRSWIDELLSTSWTACQGSDIIIESPSAMAGIHIAEALEIPYFRAFTMPWTRTRAYPHAFIVPEQKMGGSYNYLTYVMFDNVFWKGISGQVNRWRKRDLHLPRTSLDQIQQSRVPFMYSVSPSVLVPPVDFSDWVRVTGYWFLDESDNYTPDPALVDFIAKARADKAKLVYIGFGSIVVSNPTELTKAVVESVLRADIRCILSKGWSDRLGDKDSKIPEIPLPPEIFQIDSAPHDWLFPQMDAAVHHGGSGTTGASLRFGLPTIIKPFFGDQFFYANRVEDLGAGIHLKKLTVNQFSKALWEVTHNERIISRAVRIGNEIKAENGVQNAIQFIYRQMDYAKSLIKTSGKNEIGSGMTSIASTPVSTPSEEEGRLHSTDDSWTFIEEGKD